MAPVVASDIGGGATGSLVVLDVVETSNPQELTQPLQQQQQQQPSSSPLPPLSTNTYANDFITISPALDITKTSAPSSSSSPSTLPQHQQPSLAPIKVNTHNHDIASPAPSSAQLSKSGSLSASSAKLEKFEKKEDQNVLISMLKDQPNCFLWGFIAVTTISAPIVLFIAAVCLTILHYVDTVTKPSKYWDTMITLWVAFGGILVADIALAVILLISYLQDRAEKKHENGKV